MISASAELMNVRSATFRFACLAVYAAVMTTLAVSGENVHPAWHLVAFGGALVAILAAARRPHTAAQKELRALLVFGVAPACLLVPTFVSEWRDPGSLSPYAPALISVGLLAHFGGALWLLRDAAQKSVETEALVASTFDERTPRLRPFVLTFVVLAAVAMLVGPSVVVPYSALETRWPGVAREASALSSLINVAIATTWIGVLMRDVTRKPGPSERIATRARHARLGRGVAVASALILAYVLTR